MYCYLKSPRIVCVNNNNTIDVEVRSEKYRQFCPNE